MGFYNGNNNSIQGVAEAAISKGDCIVLGTVATNGQYVTPAGAGEIGIGFAAEDIAAEGVGQIIVNGVAQALAHDNAISAGNWLKAAAAGRVDGTTTDTNVLVAIALGASSAQDDLIDVLIVHGMHAG